MKGWVKKVWKRCKHIMDKRPKIYLDVLEYSSDKMLPLIYVLMIPAIDKHSIYKMVYEGKLSVVLH